MVNKWSSIWVYPIKKLLISNYRYLKKWKGLTMVKGETNLTSSCQSWGPLQWMTNTKTTSWDKSHVWILLMVSIHHRQGKQKPDREKNTEHGNLSHHQPSISASKPLDSTEYCHLETQHVLYTKKPSVIPSNNKKGKIKNDITGQQFLWLP